MKRLGMSHWAVDIVLMTVHTKHHELMHTGRRAKLSDRDQTVF